MVSLKKYLINYLNHRPLFLSLIRAKESYLYQEYLPFKKPVLDIGCGDGFFAKMLLLPIPHEKIDIGLDVADSRIKESYKENIYKKVVTYDGSHMPFPKNYFYTAFSNSVLEHVAPLNEVLAETYRVLKPNGLFIAPVIAKPWEKYLFGAKLFGSWYQKTMRKKQVHVNMFSKEGWDKVFKKAGFKIVKTVGHIDKTTCELIDVCHYLSIPSLITYKLFGTWILFPSIIRLIYPLEWLSSIISKNTAPDKSGAIFYILQKKF